MEAGSYFLHLKEFVDYFMISTLNHGMVIQNFVNAICDFLTFYQNQINETLNMVTKRRDEECLL
jgi:hypothetical protein